MTTPLETALDELGAHVALLRRLPAPSRHDPEAWHIGRDALAHEFECTIGRLAAGLGLRLARGALQHQRDPAHRRLQSSRGEVVDDNGRRVPVLSRQPRRPRATFGLDRLPAR